VPDGLTESGAEQNFGVVVRVHVDQAGHHPLARSIDSARSLGQTLSDRGHFPVADSDVGSGRHRTGSVEHRAATDHHIKVRHPGLSILISIQSIPCSMLLAMSPVKPPRTRPTRDEVRDRILDAASKVFAAEGFAGATIDAIGQAAGFTKGADYSNFESKDELFLALLDREFEHRGEQIATALEGGGDIAAAARELSRSVLDGVHGHADYYVLFVEYWLRAVRDPQLRERLIERRRAAAADQALNIVESTATVPSDRQVADLAQLVVTINLGIAMEEVLRPGTIDPELLAQLIQGLLTSVAVSAD